MQHTLNFLNLFGRQAKFRINIFFEIRHLRLHAKYIPTNNMDPILSISQECM
jgi:hypothetical protein